MHDGSCIRGHACHKLPETLAVITRTADDSTMGVSPMRISDDQNGPFVVPDFAHDPVVSHPDAPQPSQVALQRGAGMGGSASRSMAATIRARSGPVTNNEAAILAWRTIGRGVGCLVSLRRNFHRLALQATRYLGLSERTLSRYGVSGAWPRTVAVSAILIGLAAALVTTDTMFGSPLDTVENIASGIGGQFAMGAPLRFNAIQLMSASASHRRRPGGTAIV